MGTLMVAAVAGAQSKTAVPDAQVEANVLKALADAPELASQNIQSSTTYGVVTLSGNVHDEALRSKAENIVARVSGVKKVVDQLALGDTPPPTDGTQTADAAAPGQPAPDGPPVDAQGQPLVPQQDGSYAPGAPSTSSETGMAENMPADGSAPPPPPPSGRRPLYNGNGGNGYYANAPQGGQVGGQPVTVPAGQLISVRINRGIDSNHIAPGTPFTGILMNDVLGPNVVAIPRGAQVNGVVVDAEKAKALSGKGQLALQINSVILGGQVYPIQSSIWMRQGRDKTGHTVGNAVGLGAFGALLGAAVGGGAGAVVGGAVGAGAGVAASAGGPGGRVLVAPEAVLSFTLAAPAEVRTVSQAEMQRLAYGAGPGPQQPPPPAYYRRGYYSPYPY
ncbi:BON domain-containing protein [Granulicella cerasi]|uniref:BON domain-containing protein n=1 Tax=Granulicella cerasi TaxID=741063 RepID=A0ABW1ZEU5_9BACT